MKFSYERAATILAESELFGEKQTAQRWGVTVRTIKNYRKRMESDEQFSAFFLEKKELLASDWSKDATDCLRTSLKTLTSLIENHESDPRRILAVANTVKVVGELKIASDVLGDD